MTGQTIFSRFARQAKSSPGALAVRDERRAITYAQIASLASEIASRLPDDTRFVGIVMDHGIEMIAAMLAVLMRGAAYVPAEPSFPVERIQFMMTEADVDAVITQRSHDALFRSARRIFVEEGMEIPETAPIVSTAGAAEDLAYVLYTSGTTGTPKGVCVENRNVVSYVSSFQKEFGIGPNDIMLQHSVCSFDIFVEEVFATLLNGATLAIPSARVRDSVELLAEYVDETGVTIVDGFPYLIDEFNRLERPPRSVRLYVSGGDVLRESYCDRLLVDALVYNTYGPSETTCCASYYRVNGGSALDDGTYPVGRAIESARIDILDDELKSVPAGEVGEICISGEGVSRGYLGERPEQENFVWGPHGRMYRSGDLGYILPDGNVAFLHRKDSQVMIGGRRAGRLRGRVPATRDALAGQPDWQVRLSDERVHASRRAGQRHRRRHCELARGTLPQLGGRQSLP